MALDVGFLKSRTFLEQNGQSLEAPGFRLAQGLGDNESMVPVQWGESCFVCNRAVDYRGP